MNNKFMLLTTLLLFTAVSFAGDYERIGGFLFGGTVAYDVSRLGPNKYVLEANTVNGVSEKELLGAYKARAHRLCRAKKTDLYYKITTETYMGTFNATVKLPMTAPKIAGIVTCK